MSEWDVPLTPSYVIFLDNSMDVIQAFQQDQSLFKMPFNSVEMHAN